MIGEHWGDMVPIRELSVKAIERGLQEWSGENDCEGGMI